MDTILKAADLTSAELAGLLDTLAPPPAEPVRVWLEAPDGWALTYWRGLAGVVPWCAAGRDPHNLSAREAVARSFAGRLFTPSGELRWRLLPMFGERCCRTVYLGAAAWAPGTLEPRPELQDGRLQPTREEVLLWGQQTKRTPGEWIELRIPHRFCYPVDALDPAGGRVGVKAEIEVWRDQTGEMHFLRMCDLHPYREM